MKKTLIFILMILVLIVSSCNLFLKEEYGELILSFDGSLPDGARALGHDGLPVLSTTSMKITIVRDGGYTVIRDLDTEEPKSLVELIPVGEKIEISVTAYNASSQWSGRTAHTVTSGQNHVKVLLNKNISGLKNLLFTQTGDGQHGYNLTFYMDGKEINAPGPEKEFSFARDSKGRVYVLYKDASNSFHIARYTSEGELDVHPASTTTIEFLANDYTTGKMYGIDGSRDVYEIQENLLPSSAPIANLGHYQGIAAIDNNRVVWLLRDGPNPLKIEAKNLDGSSSSGPEEIKDHITITGCEESKVNDLFIRGDYVYVLFTTVNESITSSASNLYSLGGIARYNINDLAAPPVKIGFSNSVSFEDSLLKNYDYSKNFYGAVKVIGFDEENIYIADDGFDAADTPAGARIVKNRNRIAALNIATNALSFSDERTAKWYNEWREWRTPNTKMIVWKSDADSSRIGMSYYQVERGDEDLSSAHPFITSGVYTPIGVLYSDVFCYDSAGNFYVSGKDGSDEKLYRYVLKDDGSYETDGEKDISNKPEAMAVSVSSIAADAGRTILFYYKAPLNYPYTHKIERLAWPTDTFSYAATAPEIKLADLGEYDTVTAMAANKDGIFVAVKTVNDKNTQNEKYMIRVKKYAHQRLDSPGYISAAETVTVIDETSTNYTSPWTQEQANAYINEDLNALYISDGVLYGLTTNQKGYIYGVSSMATEVFIGGKLLKIGNTKSLGSYVVVLYKNDGLRPATSGEFAPYRFIAVKPKKLVIASDGYYGKGTAPRNKNKVFVFDIGNWAHPDETVTHVRINFSKQLSYSGGSFIWTSE